MSVIRAALLMVAGGIIGAGTYHLYDSRAFPVVGEICAKVDGQCIANAKYKNWTACQNEIELGNMLCDRSTPGRVTCLPTTDTMAVGQCVNR